MTGGPGGGPSGLIVLVSGSATNASTSAMVGLTSSTPSGPGAAARTASPTALIAGSLSPRHTGFGSPLIRDLCPLRPQTPHPRSFLDLSAIGPRGLPTPSSRVYGWSET